MPKDFLDVGTGCGLMALLLTRQGLKGRGIDVLPQWIELARRSAAESGLDVAFDIEDARELPVDSIDLVLCNPPYFSLESGTPSPNPFRAAARHECAGTLEELIRACARTGERVCLSLPVTRMEEAAHFLESAQRPVSRKLFLEQGIGLIEGRRGTGPSTTETGSLRANDHHGPIASRLFAKAGARLQTGARA
jgi:tRNA1Val (adenine37-N6)-methyltransferase